MEKTRSSSLQNCKGFQKHSSSQTVARGQHFKHFLVTLKSPGPHFGNIKAQRAPQHSPAASLAHSKETIAASD